MSSIMLVIFALMLVIFALMLVIFALMLVIFTLFESFSSSALRGSAILSRFLFLSLISESLMCWKSFLVLWWWHITNYLYLCFFYF